MDVASRSCEPPSPGTRLRDRDRCREDGRERRYPGLRRFHRQEGAVPLPRWRTDRGIGSGCTRPARRRPGVPSVAMAVGSGATPRFPPLSSPVEKYRGAGLCDERRRAWLSSVRSVTSRPPCEPPRGNALERSRAMSGEQADERRLRPRRFHRQGAPEMAPDLDGSGPRPRPPATRRIPSVAMAVGSGATPKISAALSPVEKYRGARLWR